jgi:hypothetical protein
LNKDALKLYSSTNCNKTFALRVIRQATSPEPYTPYTKQSTVVGSFDPSPEDWRTEKIPLRNLAGQTDVRFKFELTPGGGNTLYIDSLVVLEPAIVTEVALAPKPKGLTIFPNPAEKYAQITLPSLADYNYTVRDVVSKTVASGRGHGRIFTLDVNALQTGPYIITVQQGSKSYHHRLLVQKAQ